VPAALRNIVRLIDFLPAFYSVGVIACLASSRNQRLGDMAAGTLVVRSDPARRRPATVPGAARSGAGPGSAGAQGRPAPAGWDLTAVRTEDLVVVRSFLARRDELEDGARGRVAGELARRLAPLVVGPDPAAGDEAFLEAIVAAKDDRA
jgi:hypothetical protein